MNNTGKYFLGCGGAILLFVVIFFLWAIGTYNGLVGAQQNLDAKWAEVQNQYQRRADLVPNLVNTVAGAANFEKSTLVEVTDARASVGSIHLDPNQAPTDPAKLEEYAKAQNALGGALSHLLAVAENYPQLHATQNFQDLQVQLEGTENRIAYARNGFNQAAQSYNVTTKTFPSVIIARLAGFTERPYFSATAGSDTPPPVKFDFGNH